VNNLKKKKTVGMEMPQEVAGWLRDFLIMISDAGLLSIAEHLTMLSPLVSDTDDLRHEARDSALRYTFVENETYRREIAKTLCEEAQRRRDPGFLRDLRNLFLRERRTRPEDPDYGSFCNREYARLMAAWLYQVDKAWKKEEGNNQRED